MNDCRHYNGFQNALCQAGVVYEDLSTGFGCNLRRPCLQRPCVDREKFPLVECPAHSPLTDEEVAEQEKESQEVWDRVERAVKVAKEDARERGFGKEPKRHGGRAVIACPICFKGNLHYAVTGSNGHMRGECTTIDCVRWVE